MGMNNLPGMDVSEVGAIKPWLCGNLGGINESLYGVQFPD
jgi:hypothetical protein